MKSPYTNKPMCLIKERTDLTFRNEKFQIIHSSYLCFDSGDSFTTTELDNQNIVQVYYQYCNKYKIQLDKTLNKLIQKYYHS